MSDIRVSKSSNSEICPARPLFRAIDPNDSVPLVLGRVT